MSKYIKSTHLLRKSTVRQDKRNQNILKDFQSGMESWRMVAKYKISRQRISQIVERELRREAHNA